MDADLEEFFAQMDRLDALPEEDIESYLARRANPEDTYISLPPSACVFGNRGQPPLPTVPKPTPRDPCEGWVFDYLPDEPQQNAPASPLPHPSFLPPNPKPITLPPTSVVAQPVPTDKPSADKSGPVESSKCPRKEVTHVEEAHEAQVEPER